jgi:hypothetical protein
MKWTRTLTALLTAAVLAAGSTAQITLSNSASAPASTFQSTVGTAHAIDTVNLQIGAGTLSRTAAGGATSYLATGVALTPATGFTIQTWFRPTGINATGTAKYMFGDAFMPSPVGGASGGNFRCFHDGVAGQGALIIRGVPNQVITPIVLTNNVWTHIALKYDPATNTISWLVNGVLSAAVVQTAGAFTWSGVNLHVFGYSGSGTSPGASGNYDDMRIYSFARTNADILADYTLAAAGNGPSGMANLPDKAYYQCDGSVEAHTCVVSTNGDPASMLDRKVTNGTFVSWGGNSINQAGNAASALINIRPGGVNPGCVTPGFSLITQCHAFSIPAGGAIIYPDGLDLNSIGVGIGIPGPYTYGGGAGPTLVSAIMPPLTAGDVVSIQFVAIDAGYPGFVGVSNEGHFKYVDALPGNHAHVEARGVGAIQTTGFWEFTNTGSVDIMQVVVDAATATGGATGFLPTGALNSGGTLAAGTSYRFGSEVITGLTGPLPGLFTAPTPASLQFDFLSFNATIDDLIWDCESVPANIAGNTYIGATVTVTFVNATVLVGTLVADPLDPTAAVVDL